MSLGELPGSVSGISTSWRASDAKVADNLKVVFDRGNSCCRAVLDHLVEIIDIRITLRAFAQHDRRMLIHIDRDRRKERRSSHIYMDFVFCSEILHAMQLFDRGIKALICDLGVSADVLHSITCEISQMLIVCRRGLAAKLH